MKTIATLLCLLIGGYASACYDCAAVVQTYAAPAVTYRSVAPVVVRETVQLERQTYERQPVIVERQEKVLQYSAPLVVQPVYASVLKVQKVQVQHVQAVQVQKVQVHAPAVRQQVIVQKQVAAPQKVIQQNTVRRGLFGRIRRVDSTTIVNP